MPWEIHAHEAFREELADLESRERRRVRDGVLELGPYLEATGGRVGPAAPPLDPSVPRPDLEPLQGASIRESYRLRVGSFRVTLALLPAEEMVLVTALRRRSDTAYRVLVKEHERRVRDR